MTIFTKARGWFVANPLFAYGGVALLGIVLGSILVLRNGGNGPETMVVSREPFLQEVSVSGKVVAAESVELGFTQSGRVSRVYAKVGETVFRGALIAEIENGDLRAAVLQKQAALEAALANLMSLEDTNREQVALEQANQAIVEKIQKAYNEADDAIRNQLDQFISSPQSANPKLAFTTSDSTITSVVEAGRLYIEGVMTGWQPKVQVLNTSSNLSLAVFEAQKSLSDVSKLLSDASAVLNRAIQNSTVTQTLINGYIADIATARSAVNTAASAITTAVTAAKDAEADLEDAPELITAKRADVKAAEADLESARAGLQKTLIVAPFSGVITQMDLKVGAIVSPNTSEVELQSLATLRIESFVPEVNISLISLGDPARITLDAFGEGAIFEASVVSLDPAETERDGVSTYKAVLEFDMPDPRIKAGMTANVVITTEEKSDVIAVPQGILELREGKQYVRVFLGDEVLEREVTTGSVSSLGTIEILSGLEEGDMVVLTP